MADGLGASVVLGRGGGVGGGLVRHWWGNSIEVK